VDDGVVAGMTLVLTPVAETELTVTAPKVVSLITPLLIINGDADADSQALKPTMFDEVERLETLVTVTVTEAAVVSGGLMVPDPILLTNEFSRTSQLADAEQTPTLTV